MVDLPLSGILGSRMNEILGGEEIFSAEVPVPLLSIHVKKNRSATKGH